MEDGAYQITFPDAENQAGPLIKLQYDSKSNCTNGIHPGNLIASFDLNDNNMKSMTLEFQIRDFPSEGYWAITSATLKISPNNKQLFPTDTIDLLPIDMYAGEKFSYSCYSLVLQNRLPTKDGPNFKITLKRFQVQPFSELHNFVFASSYDCSVWLTLPVIMGLLLILFIVFTVMIGVYLLMEQGNQTSDLRFSKQGGMLMNQAQLDATKGQ